MRGRHDLRRPCRAGFGRCSGTDPGHRSRRLLSAALGSTPRPGSARRSPLRTRSSALSSAASVAAAGFGLINWATMGAIALSWIASPILGGIIAASFPGLHRSRRSSTAARQDRRGAPLGAAADRADGRIVLDLSGAEGLQQCRHLFRSDAGGDRPGRLRCHLGLSAPSGTKCLAADGKPQPVAGKTVPTPLIISAALLSFAHGANDVANAVGPLAAIVRAACVGRCSGRRGSHSG